MYLAAKHGSLNHVVRHALLSSHLPLPFWRVWIDFRYLRLLLFPVLLRHGVMPGQVDYK